MADPFEVRMRFTGQLQHLSASVTAAQKAANFALKNRDQDEDLHSCILEQLEKNSMNNRANIMYFIEHLCDLAQRESHLAYIHYMQRDILRVIDAVCPPDGSGAANVRVVRRVLAALQSKNVLLAETVAELDALLKTREGEAHPFVEKGEEGTVEKKSGARLEKRLIEQRIEEDRERHKRLRENIWAVSEGPDGDGELRKEWEEASEIGDDDELACREEMEERQRVLGLPMKWT
ncbi:hypothetical protein M011DRAFT_463839 [Sporormia fimetaria CBS 119925]|uniref:CID domain-containing protein n=1 Tax=Sporormia fimetaria CBS 119925 TaxID=1340428 RepID=A0A6A6VPG6_9PLEO|nr:hypothetical protein M011DRAFT_463839 [Sporormia fimetaria CBS 119925]